jgi:hypothetical protein
LTRNKNHQVDVKKASDKLPELKKIEKIEKIQKIEKSNKNDKNDQVGSPLNQKRNPEKQGIPLGLDNRELPMHPKHLKENL